MPCEVLSNVDNLTIRTWLTRSLRHRISASTHMRTENVAAFEKIAFSAQSAIIGIYRYQGRKAPMPRPPRCRRICGVPQVDTFCPNGCENTEPILLTLDEYEVIRLVDLEQQTHEQCAAQMDISRSTVQEICENARRKIAACLVHGKPLHITGETTASAEDRRQLTAAVAAGCREPTWKNQAKLAKEIPL